MAFTLVSPWQLLPISPSLPSHTPLTPHPVQVILDACLEEEPVQAAANLALNPTQTMRQLRFLILRNKADVLARDDTTALAALQLYHESLGMDGGDASLWYRKGILVSTTTYFPIEHAGKTQIHPISLLEIG